MPGWVGWVFAAALAVITLPCLVRLFVRQRPPGMPDRHEDLGQALMGIVMIAMFLSLLRLLPTVVWVVLFLGQAVAFGVPLFRASDRDRDTWQYVHHVMASLAMAYVVLAVGPRMFAVEPLAAAFGMYFLGYAVVSALRTVTVVRLAPAGCAGVPALLATPKLVEACRTVMGVSMSYMLLSAA